MANKPRTLRSAFQHPAADIAENFSLNYGPDGVGKVMAAQRALHMKLQFPPPRYGRGLSSSFSSRSNAPVITPSRNLFSVGRSAVVSQQRGILASLFGGSQGFVRTAPAVRAANNNSIGYFNAPALKLAA